MKYIDIILIVIVFKDRMRPQTKTSQVFLVALGRFMLQLSERIMVLQTLQCGYLYGSKCGYHILANKQQDWLFFKI